MSPDLVEHVLSAPPAVLTLSTLALFATIAVAYSVARHSVTRLLFLRASHSGAARQQVRVGRSGEHPRHRSEGWVVEAFRGIVADLYDGDSEVRVLGAVGTWEIGLAGPRFGSPVRVEVVHGRSSTVFVGHANLRRASFYDPSTGDILRVRFGPTSLGERPRDGLDLDSFWMAAQIALVDEPDGGVLNADVARIERLLNGLPADVSEHLVEDGRLLRSRTAALALLDAVESGVPLEWALRRAGAVLA